MLASGEAAAVSALALEGLRLLTTPLDVALQVADRRALDRATAIEHPIVLVVGPPRSGTTLVYQMLAQCLPVTFFRNVSALFPRAPLTAQRLLMPMLAGGRPSYDSHYGQTPGLRGPNDAFHIWNRWLGEDRYFPERDLDPDEVADMRRFMAAWVQHFGRPLVSKNNRNTACIDTLAEALPEARFVVVRREPYFVAQSLILARAHVQGSKRHRWGLRAREASEDSPLGHVEAVCEQVRANEDALDRQLSRIPSEGYVVTRYEDVCARPGQELRRIARAALGSDSAPVAEPPARFDSANRVDPELDDEEVDRIRASLAT